VVVGKFTPSNKSPERNPRFVISVLAIVVLYPKNTCKENIRRLPVVCRQYLHDRPYARCYFHRWPLWTWSPKVGNHRARTALKTNFLPWHWVIPGAWRDRRTNGHDGPQLFRRVVKGLRDGTLTLYFRDSFEIAVRGRFVNFSGILAGGGKKFRQFDGWRQG